MLGPPKLRCLDRPMGRSIEEAVPPNHFYRFLEAKLDLSFVRDLVTWSSHWVSWIIPICPSDCF